MSKQSLRQREVVLLFSLKILEVSLPDLQQKLSDLKMVVTINRAATRTLTFDHPMLRLRQEGKVLRLRQVGGKVFFSIKAGRNDMSKSPFHKLQESEVVVDNFTKCFQLLESIGFSAFRYHEKYRTVYDLENIEVEVNEYPGIPPYIEIQADSSVGLAETVKKIGYEFNQSSPMSAIQILRHYGLKDVNIIKFPDSQFQESINNEN